MHCMYGLVLARIRVVVRRMDRSLKSPLSYRDVAATDGRGGLHHGHGKEDDGEESRYRDWQCLRHPQNCHHNNHVGTSQNLQQEHSVFI